MNSGDSSDSGRFSWNSSRSQTIDDENCCFDDEGLDVGSEEVQAKTSIIARVTDVDSKSPRETGEKERIPSRNPDCPQDCHCNVLREWLESQARKDRLVIDDPFYQAHKSELWSTEDLIENHARCNYDPIPCIDKETFRFAGLRDRWGKPRGRGRAYFPNGRIFIGVFVHGKRNGLGELYEREGTIILSGQYVEDKLDGLCKITTNEGGLLEMTFDRGVAHGPARRFGPNGGLQWLGRYRFGIPFRSCWRSNDQEGWYYGSADASGRMSGRDVIYLYPDLHTALVGTWINDGMRRSRLSKIVSVTETDGFLAPVLEDPMASKDDCFSQDVSGFSVISRQPHLRDPFEDLAVECKKSSISEGGEGLFAKRDFHAGWIVAFYNGTRLHDCHVRRLTISLSDFQAAFMPHSLLPGTQ